MIAHERRRGENLRRRISSALAYPAFLIVAAIGVLIFVLVGIIPEFERALAGFQSEEQQPFIFGLSRTVRANTDLLGIVGIVVLTAIFFAARSRAVKGFLLRVIGRVPGVRELVRHEQTVVFCATLGTLTPQRRRHFERAQADPRPDARQPFGRKDRPCRRRRPPGASAERGPPRREHTSALRGPYAARGRGIRGARFGCDADRRLLRSSARSRANAADGRPRTCHNYFGERLDRLAYYFGHHRPAECERTLE